MVVTQRSFPTNSCVSGGVLRDNSNNGCIDYVMVGWLFMFKPNFDRTLCSQTLLTLCSLVSKVPSSRVTVARASYIIRQQHAKKTKLLLLCINCHMNLKGKVTKLTALVSLCINENNKRNHHVQHNK